MNDNVQEIQNKPTAQIIYFQYWLRDLGIYKIGKMRLHFCPKAPLPMILSCSEYIQPIAQWGPQAFGSPGSSQRIIFWFTKVIQILKSPHPEHFSSLIWSTFISISLHMNHLSLWTSYILWPLLNHASYFPLILNLNSNVLHTI